MLIKPGTLIALYLLVLFCAIACIDNSAKKMNKEVFFNPSYSLPIGPAQIVAKNIINSSNFQNIDTSIDSDTIGYFWYDSVFYNDGPGYFDTLVIENFDFSTISDKLDIAKSLMIRLNVTNGFPTDILTQLYFDNGNNVVLDSLFNSGYLRIISASINSDGNVTNPSVLRNYDTYLNRSEIDLLKQARNVKLFIRIELRHNDIEYIKLYPYYTIDLDLALRIELDMNLGDI
jgi:hypothetical protein